MCAGNMPGHTPMRTLRPVSTDTLCVCVCVRAPRRNCIFLHRARFFSRHFVSPQNARATLEIKTPRQCSAVRRALQIIFKLLFSTDYTGEGERTMTPSLKRCHFSMHNSLRQSVLNRFTQRSVTGGACP